MSQEGMRLSEHIGELRQRLKVVVYAVLIVLVVVVFLPANPAYQVQHPQDYVDLQFLDHTIVAAFLHTVQGYVLPKGWTLIAATGLGEGMEIYFIAALLMTAALCMPVIAYEVYRFIDPALKPEERQLIYPFVTSTSVLFVVGVLFGYFVLAKFLVIALAPFLLASGITFQIDAASFYYVIFLIIGATGVSFTSPVFVYALIRLRVLDASFFHRNRVVIWFIIWVITGLFLTPDGGPLLDVVIFVPIVALVEGAVWLAGRSVRGAPAPSQAGGPARCKHCGAELRQGGMFCPTCGRAQG